MSHLLPAQEEELEWYSKMIETKTAERDKLWTAYTSICNDLTRFHCEQGKLLRQLYERRIK
jgi:hypothetical protein